MQAPIIAWTTALAALGVPRGGVAGGGYSREGYTDRVSYSPGDTIGVSVSTTSPTWTLQVIRSEYPWWEDEPVVAEAAGLPGEFHPQPAQAWLGADWPVSHSIEVGPGWQSGGYVAKLIAEDGTTRYHPFFIRPAVPGSTSRILYVANFNTVNAYNWWGGKSLYKSVPPASNGNAVAVSFERPLIEGMGQAEINRNLHCHLEEMGFALEYLTEWDIDRDPCLLRNYDVVIFGGHHEYVTSRFYDAIQDHHDRGGHLAFFSGDDLYWQVRYEDGGAIMVGYKGKALDDDPLAGLADCLVTTRWHESLLDRPAEALKGVRRTSGFEWFLPEDYLVQTASHWIFEGTGLQDGDALGTLMANGEQDYLKKASPDVDVVLYAFRDQPDPADPPPSGVNGTSVCAIFYADTPQYGFPGGNGGMVFAAGTIAGWVANLQIGPQSAMVQQVTANIVAAMAAATPPPAPSECVVPAHCPALVVPHDAPTIQAAIDTAPESGTIVISPGTYFEAIDLGGKTLSLRSTGGAGVTIIDAAGGKAPVVTCAGGQGPETLIDGLTLRGGAAPVGGGMLVEDSSPTISNCVVTGNAAGSGGGMALCNSGALVVQCLVTGNTATGSGGGAAVTGLAAPSFINCTFSGNSAGDGGAVADLAGAALANCILFGNSPGEITGGSVSYSLVAGGAPGTANINGDPLFGDAAAGDYRLTGGSPAIDAGLNSAIEGQVTGDLGGTPRLQDDPNTPDCAQSPDTCGAAPVVDLGAFEFEPPPVPWPCGDVDGSGVVNVIDLLAVLNFGPCDGCPADLNGDGDVNVSDLLQVLGTWGPCVF